MPGLQPKISNFFSPRPPPSAVKVHSRNAPITPNRNQQTSSQSRRPATPLTGASQSSLSSMPIEDLSSPIASNSQSSTQSNTQSYKRRIVQSTCDSDEEPLMKKAAPARRRIADDDDEYTDLLDECMGVAKREPISNTPQADTSLDQEILPPTGGWQGHKRRAITTPQTAQRATKKLKTKTIDTDDDMDDNDSKPVRKFDCGTEKAFDSFQAQTPRSAPARMSASRSTKNALDVHIPIDEEEEIAMRKSTLTAPAEPSETSKSKREYSTPFLDADKICDAKGNRPGTPDYDPTTLYIPSKYYKPMTPAEEQFWQLKAQNFDTVFLFKIGKFYEMFDMDAEIGVRELGLSYMVNKARPHCGFPEPGYEKFAGMLVQAGYKVGRVEQTQTPKELSQANSQVTNSRDKKKVVERSLCSILTTSTITDPELIKGYQANYLLAIKERSLTDEEMIKNPIELPLGGKAQVELGVCFTDASTGRVHVGQFYDDNVRTQLCTLLSVIAPEEVIVLSGNLSDITAQVLRAELKPKTLKSMWKLTAKQFLDARDTYETLKAKQYFVTPIDESKPDSELLEDWPPVLMDLLDHQSELAFSSLGGMLHVMQRTMIDRTVLSQKNFDLYTPNMSGLNAQFLILDHKAMSNLEIVRDGDGTEKGSLLAYVDNCVSPMGHRMMKRWISQPLASISAINDRLNAVEFLMKHRDLCESATQLLKSLPDLERLISSIAAFAIKKEKTEMLYGNQENRKLVQFEKVLDGLNSALAIRMSIFAECDENDLKSTQLASCTLKYPDYRNTIGAMRDNINFTEAKKLGVIKPKPGVVDSYDVACEEVIQAEKDLEDYLVEIRKTLKNRTIVYKHIQKDRYTLEVPRSLGALPHQYQIITSTKSHQRYHTDQLTRVLIPALEDAELDKERIEKDATRMIYAKFAAQQAIWQRAVRALAELDCLCSLARVSLDQMASCGHSIRPEFLEFEQSRGGTGKAVLELVDAVHPVLAKNGLANHGSFIENSTLLGCRENPSRFILVSGPNMGGKSTLLRQTCSSVILAHLGCFVPARSCRLTPVDRIFTRVGANDAIMIGQSTFMVELMETSTIVRHASPRSLVILDELGRGTSTFDGTAIAYAVVKYLLDKVDCLSLFSTHYHRLMQEFAADKRVSMFHMACSEPEDADGSDIVFLYKFIRGECPKSHGMNVARMAKLPEPVIRMAIHKSEQFEERFAGYEKSMLSNKMKIVVKKEKVSLEQLQAALTRFRIAA